MSDKDKKRPTLKTIAYMTGLGVTTVSKALKDAPDIKVSTKQRVKTVAAQIGYQPDRAGLRLRTGKTNIICLTLSADEEVASMTSPFISGVMLALQNTQYNLVLSPYVREIDPMESVRHIVETRLADGIILSQIEANDPRLTYLNKVGMPFATHGRSKMGLEHAFVDFDGEQYGKEAVQLLAGKGCQRIGLLAAPSTFSYGQFMRDGFAAGLRETGLQESPLDTISLHDPLEKIADTVCQLMQQESIAPDAFVCGSAGAAIGVMSGVERAGLTIGGDVHIVSKQPSTNLLKWFGRPVHIIEDDFKAAGFGVATSLIRVIDGEPVSENQTVVYPECRAQVGTDPAIQA